MIRLYNCLSLNKYQLNAGEKQDESEDAAERERIETLASQRGAEDATSNGGCDPKTHLG